MLTAPPKVFQCFCLIGFRWYRSADRLGFLKVVAGGGIEPKKTGEKLEVPLHPTLESHLQGLAGDRGGAISPGLSSVPTSGRSGLSKQFLLIMKNAGISNDSKGGAGQRSLSQLSFHALRTSFNSALHNQGVSQEVRKKLTGHKSDAVNDRYTRTEMDTLREAVGKLPGLKTDQGK
jgi:integrase